MECERTFLMGTLENSIRTNDCNLAFFFFFFQFHPAISAELQEMHHRQQNLSKVLNEGGKWLFSQYSWLWKRKQIDDPSQMQWTSSVSKGLGVWWRKMLPLLYKQTGLDEKSRQLYLRWRSSGDHKQQKRTGLSVYSKKKKDCWKWI